MVAGHREQRQADGSEEPTRPLELLGLAAVGQVAGGQQELRLGACDELREHVEGLDRIAVAEMDIGQVENARGHGRGRLYTRSMANESPELFDDIYLGLRAGGAVRKQRRGEPLTSEEVEAIGRWRSLSFWRKSLAIGAFALGTFGLGLTVGGLIFGRWRTAKR